MPTAALLAVLFRLIGKSNASRGKDELVGTVEVIRAMAGQPVESLIRLYIVIASGSIIMV